MKKLYIYIKAFVMKAFSCNYQEELGAVQYGVPAAGSGCYFITTGDFLWRAVLVTNAMR